MIFLDFSGHLQVSSSFSYLHYFLNFFIFYSLPGFSVLNGILLLVLFIFFPKNVQKLSSGKEKHKIIKSSHIIDFFLPQLKKH